MHATGREVEVVCDTRILYRLSEENLESLEQGVK